MFTIVLQASGDKKQNSSEKSSEGRGNIQLFFLKDPNDDLKNKPQNFLSCFDRQPKYSIDMGECEDTTFDISWQNSSIKEQNSLIKKSSNQSTNSTNQTELQKQKRIIKKSSYPPINSKQTTKKIKKKHNNQTIEINKQ